MPGRFVAVPGTNTIEAMVQGVPMHQRGMHVLWGRSYPGFYLNERNDEKNPWTQQGGYWPSRSNFLGDPADPSGPTVLLANESLGGFRGGQYEPCCIGYGGNASLKFIMGKCKDASGVAIGGATVQGFRTSNDQFVRETLSDSNGNYELGTEYPGENHYLVAYVAGSPDRAGTTVNTLQPTNRDGS